MSVNGSKNERGFLRSKKVYFIVVIFSVLIIVTTVITVITVLNLKRDEKSIITLRVSDSWRPEKLDPIEAREPPCVWVISQVAEGLFDYNEIFNEIMPNLALSYSVSSNHLEFTFKLRQGVKFHDGTDLNAQAVKWNFDRLHNMMTLFPDDIPEARLWKLPDGSRIINTIQVINETEIKFVLNEPYAPFLALLTTWSAFILSPTSTPATDLIELSTGDLIGTGPFIYDEYVPGSEVRLSANSKYWGGKPNCDKLIFIIFGYSVGNENVVAMNESLYSGDIDLLPKLRRSPILGNYSDFSSKIQSEPTLLLNDEGLVTTYNYIGMNYNLINLTWRKALSYALDYDKIINELQGGWADRMRSPIPKGIPYSNTVDFDVPIQNLTIARQTIKYSLGSIVATLPLDEDGPWISLVSNNTPLATFNFSYNQDDTYKQALLNVMQENFEKIGVKIVGAPMPNMNFIYRLYDLLGYHRNMLELYHIGWNADYNDPFNYVNQLMSNDSADNFSQINDQELQLLIDQAQIEYNSTIREGLYYDIQERCIEELFPWILLDIPKIISIQSANIEGFVPSSMLWKVTLKNISFL